MNKPKSINFKIGNEEITIETGRMAKQAHGSVLISSGGTSVIATVCYGQSVSDDADFVPLSVEYNEKYYAAGKIPGGFLKREGRPKDKEILVSRLIDRPIRPLLKKELKKEVQIVPTTVSADQINPPDVLAILGSSAALSISCIPFDGPVAALRICMLDGEFLLNPSFSIIDRADIDIIVAGTKDGITMVEGAANEALEEDMIKAIDIAREEIKRVCLLIEDFAKEVGQEKLPIEIKNQKLANHDNIYNIACQELEKACFVKGKTERHNSISNCVFSLRERFVQDLEEGEEKIFDRLLSDIQKQILRKTILDKDLRLDGRNTKQIRDIECEISVLPRVHGSALFTRGETQALAITTLGTIDDEMRTDDIDGDKRDKFMLHYNFPPFSVGETGRLSTGRREIGHGHLAFRAVSKILPNGENLPYTIRIVSEILESNGSSSMATVCGSSLALMDAGIPIKKHVAGIAMGLITEGDRFAVLSDILGEEDHLGDMDFKVAGTDAGITAFQMDIKIQNVSSEILKIALSQAKDGRMHILSIMNQSISSSKEDVSEFAPKIIKFKIPSDKIGNVIGTGGKTIKAINEKHGVDISIEQSGDVRIYASNSKSSQDAKEEVLACVFEPKSGDIMDGTVTRIAEFGAFIELPSKKEGLCHISKIIPRGKKGVVEDFLKVGQKVKVKIMHIDRQHRINLVLVNNKHDENANQETKEG